MLPSGFIEVVEFIRSVSGILAFLILMFLPGTWVSFGLRLNTPFWARVFIGSMLSPLVVCLQFYAVRLLGASFELTCVLLAIGNAPALILILKNHGRWRFPDRYTLVGMATIVLIPLASMAPLMFDLQRMYLGHAWIYAEPSYLFARGDLVLEDPDLAGMRLGYPVWGELLYQGVLSFLLDSPPMASFVWNHLIWLILIYSFAGGIATELGGGKLARYSAGFWLFFGVNAAGYGLQHLVPEWFAQRYNIWGDWRYTPWVLKFWDFNTMPLVLGILTALLYVLVRSSVLSRSVVILICLLASSVGIFYPILFPVVAVLLGARALSLLVERDGKKRLDIGREWFALAGVMLVSTLAMLATLHFLTADRVTGTGVKLTALNWTTRTAQAALVIAPLAAGLIVSILHCWRSRRSRTVMLALTGVISSVMSVAIFIPYWSNEYKFIFTAAICLAPFAAIATEIFARKIGDRRAIPVLTLVAVLLVAPFIHKVYYWEGDPDHRIPSTDIRSFHLRLDPVEPLSRLCDAIRRAVPPDGILLLQNGEHHFPSLTGRSMYVPPRNISYTGVNQGADALLALIRGYGQEVLTERRAILAGVFDADDNLRRLHALKRVQSLGRPIAIILEPHHKALLEHLRQDGWGAQVYHEKGFTIWLIPTESFSPQRSLRVMGS